MKYLLIGLVLFVSATGNIFSQISPSGTNPAGTNLAKNGIIKGKIFDAETKSPMEYANVAIYRKQDSKLITGGITGPAGDFEIGELPYDTYYVEAGFIGFDKTTVNDLKIIPGSTTIDLGTIELKVFRQQVGTVEVVALNTKSIKK